MSALNIKKKGLIAGCASLVLVAGIGGVVVLQPLR
jgi:hypothetical protein